MSIFVEWVDVGSLPRNAPSRKANGRSCPKEDTTPLNKSARAQYRFRIPSHSPQLCEDEGGWEMLHPSAIYANAPLRDSTHLVAGLSLVPSLQRTDRPPVFFVVLLFLVRLHVGRRGTTTEDSTAVRRTWGVQG